MRGARRALAPLAVLALLAATGTAPATAAAGSAAGPPPAGFFGVVPQGPLSASDLRRMGEAVETLRLPVLWSSCEPRRGEFDFSATDAVLAAAAERGIRVMPVLYGTPSWLSRDEARPPLAPAALSAWKGFLRRLVRRYGPGGGLWRGAGRAEPVRRWQIWNEPNFRLFWEPRISPRGYARLLGASAAAIRAADPEAQIVLAGVAPVGAGMKTWVFLRRLLRVPGALRHFDIAALHPYAASVAQMDYQVTRVRAAMAAGGAGRRPLIVSEIGVASHGLPPSAFVKGRLGQAEFLEAAFARLLAMRQRWRIAGVDWFAWADEAAPDPHCSFCQGAGLFDLDGRPKPAWSAYRGVVARAAAGLPPSAMASRPSWRETSGRSNRLTAQLRVGLSSRSSSS
ncbi:MAG: beta-galactosidase [Solirubrobacterales bacterium]